jgi:hypothetical protein
MPISTPSTLSAISGFSEEDEHDLVSVSPPERSPRLTSRPVPVDDPFGLENYEKHQIEHFDVRENKPIVENETGEPAQAGSIEEEVQRKMDETVRRVREQSDR